MTIIGQAGVFLSKLTNNFPIKTNINTCMFTNLCRPFRHLQATKKSGEKFNAFSYLFYRFVTSRTTQSLPFEYLCHSDFHESPREKKILSHKISSVLTDRSPTDIDQSDSIFTFHPPCDLIKISTEFDKVCDTVRIRSRLNQLWHWKLVRKNNFV